jgi:hypothetical protein
MKKVLFILALSIIIVACKKTKFSPEGPTDIRVENQSTLTWQNVVVNTSVDKDSFPSIAPSAKSVYKRFDKAFNIAEISALINGQKYSTGTVNFTYLAYIGQAKITYSVYIKNDASRLLEISNCSLDAPLDSL